MLVSSKKKKSYFLFKIKKIVFQSQTPKLKILHTKEINPHHLLIYSEHMHDIQSVYSIVVFLTMKKGIFMKKVYFAAELLVLQTLQSHQTILCNVRKAERVEDSTEGNFPLMLHYFRPQDVLEGYFNLVYTH